MSRDERRFSEDPPNSPRTAFQRDCDRILYCSAFRRLANITQVVAADQGYIFHNRLTHALKVAQIGRRLAEKLTATPAAVEMAKSLGGLDPDVVEAAGLAHDLGHPPFGHLAEITLDQLVRGKNVAGGYEGNAQSFRIVTKLAIRTEEQVGLNLTRATLNAILKYPWMRSAEGPKSRKWSVYQSEEDDFVWAREGLHGDERKTLEAEIMDYADDIAYSVFDMEDFYRAGKIPLDQLVTSSPPTAEVNRFLSEVFERWQREGRGVADTEPFQKAFADVAQFFPDRPYSGTRSERAFLRDMTSLFVGRYMNEIALHEPTNAAERRVVISPAHQREIKMMKELTWHYVITNPSLGTQQHGYTVVIEELFAALLGAGKAGQLNLFPPSVQELLQPGPNDAQLVRIVADLIASMNEQQALGLYQRLKGISIGSFFTAIY